MLFFIRDLKLDSGGPGEGSLSTRRRSGSEPRDDEVADRARLDGRSPSGREAVFVGTSRVEFWVSDKKSTKAGHQKLHIFPFLTFLEP